MNPQTTAPATTRRPLPRDSAKILNDTRDLAVHRLLLSFTSMLDRVGDLLMMRAEKTYVRDDQTVYLDARDALAKQRTDLMAAFETRLRERVDDRISGKDNEKLDLASIDARDLTLVEDTTMEEKVIAGNITRMVENMCADELLILNRAIGHLLGQPDLALDANPFAPSNIVRAFTEALRSLPGDLRIKFTILKELNQSSLGDLSEIYADLNRHLISLNVVPAPRRMAPRPGAPPGRGGAASRGAGAATEGAEVALNTELDLMALLQRMMSHGGIQRAHAADGTSAGFRGPGAGPFGLPTGGMMPPAAPPVLGGMGGPRVLVTPELSDALSRLQQGETGFDVGGATVQFAGVPEGKHNVLRDLQESPLAAKANQLESMTIELVAMLFDFIFESKDLPDSIKALLGRLQIPVLKAAMIDGAFFSKKNHPSRLLVNALGAAGIGWSPTMGTDDPLYKKIESIVRQILDDFSEDIGLFERLRLDLEQFLASEERAAEANVRASAEEINRRDRQEIARVMARSEIERELSEKSTPNFLASFLREKWVDTLAHIYAHEGEQSDAWSAAIATLNDLIWSVQPKRAPEDRRRLVATLPNLLKRLHGGLTNVSWDPGERERFMANLVEAHAAAVKASLGAVGLPTVAVAEAAAAAAEKARAEGDTEAASRAKALSEAMAPAPRAVASQEEVETPEQDFYSELATTLERGMWVEFEGDDGQLVFAKLAWISPLRGTYLFTNRQGQKAVSLTADDLAAQFRADRARMVEAEPLIDRAFTSMMSVINEKFEQEAA